MTLEAYLESAVANLKLVDQALSGMQGSYVELLTILALGALAVVPVLVPQKNRQLWRHLVQAFGVLVFVFVVYTCLGVFGLVRNLFKGLEEVGRENILALYFASVPAVVLTTSLLFGPSFCGWVCPTGALQELAAWPLKAWHRKRRASGYPFSKAVLIGALAVAMIFLLWVAHLAATRIFFLEDASLYWSEILVLVLLALAWRQRQWDGRLRRLRVISFWVILAAAVLGLRVTSPVHFGFAKVYDPASLLGTVMVVLAALVVPRVWCRYLCPWREAIGWAGKHAVRHLVVIPGKCTSCDKCSQVCEVDAVRLGQVNQKECHLCLECVDACPEKAIQVKDDWSEKGKIE